MKNLALSFKNIYLIQAVLRHALLDKEWQLKQAESETLKKFRLQEIAEIKEALDAFQAANAQNNYILSEI
jgi:glucosamine 6-phosphate synthetase-like amidotransferase/phosphosugar isomerase protein